MLIICYAIALLEANVTKINWSASVPLASLFNPLSYLNFFFQFCYLQHTDKNAPNPKLCATYGSSAMVLDQRVFITFNPFNVST